MKLSFSGLTLDISSEGKAFLLTRDGKEIRAEIVHSEAGKLELLIDGRRVTAYISSDNARHWVTVNGQTYVLTRSSGGRRGGPGAHHAAGELTAPMPGQIRAVNVSEGETVTKGQTLLVLEAMKMEIRIHAPFDGVVTSVAVKSGETVEREQILVEVSGG